MINVLICDDDEYTRRMLEKIVSQRPFTSRIHTASDGVEALSVARETSLDIVLMDIDMPRLNGIEAAKTICALSPDAKFIFITAYMDYAIESFSVHPYNYLLKPLDIGKLEKNLDEMKSHIKKLPDSSSKIAVKNENSIYFIHIDEILFFEKVTGKLLVHTAEESYTLNKTLSEIESSITGNFLRVHRSFIVNMDKMSTITNLGNRSYQVDFHESEKKALMSRYRFEDLKDNIVTL